MSDPPELSLEHFSGRVREPFQIRALDSEGEPPAPAVEVVLTEAVSLGAPMAAGLRAPFSLMFTGPGEPIMPQGLYHVEHAGMTATVMFLVPLQPGASGARYQAVFN